MRELQAVIGRETREQILAAEGRLPDAVVACVGGGSNAIGMFAGFVEDDVGQVQEAESISAGLDYPGVGPEHAYLADTGRATYEPVTDAEAMDAFRLLCRTEGIIPAIESAHAIAGAVRLGRTLGPDAMILVNLSGRGDKDVDTAARWFRVVDPEALPTEEPPPAEDADGAVASGEREL